MPNLTAAKSQKSRQNPPRGIPICARCNRENDRPAQRYCLDCHAAYMRDWRKTHPLFGGARMRDSARSYAKEYRKRDHLQKEPCRVCGDANTEMHHPDHELPLMVVWLCRRCHLAWHSFWRQAVTEVWVFWENMSRREPPAEAEKPEHLREAS